MRKLFIILIAVFFFGFFNACSKEDVTPAQDGGQAEESTDEQWLDNWWNKRSDQDCKLSKSEKPHFYFWSSSIKPEVIFT